MSQSASAVSRALHIVDDRLKELERAVEAQKVPGGGVVDFPALVGPDAWWVEPALAALSKAPGRVLHTACGDGWLVRRLGAAGIDAYGVDPRSALVDRAELGVLDLRGEGVADHLRAVAASALGGVVLSGVVEGQGGGERTAAAQGPGQPDRPGRDAGRPLGDPGHLGGGGRPVRDRLGDGAPVAGRDLVRALGLGRLRGLCGGRTRGP